MSTQPVLPSPVLHHTLVASEKAAAVGVAIVASIFPVALFFKFLEVTHRAAGGEPKWPMNLDEECQLEQFRNLPACTDPTEISFRTTVCFLVIGGAVVGALWSFVFGGRNQTRTPA